MSPTQDEQLRGAGPWSLDVPALDAQESEPYDLRTLVFNGKRGFFRDYTPLDGLRVVNQSSSEPLEVLVNGRYTVYVPPNTVQSPDDVGVSRLRLTNTGSQAIADGEIVCELATTGYGADDAARESQRKPWVQRAADDLIPGGLPGGGRG